MVLFDCRHGNLPISPHFLPNKFSLPPTLASTARMNCSGGRDFDSTNSRNPWIGRMPTMPMMTRRHMLEAAGTAALIAGPGAALSQLLSPDAESKETLTLSPALPEGTRAE